MQSNFTREFLVKHIYNETTREESAVIEQALESDAALRAEMQQLREAKFALDHGDRDRPHRTTLARIRSYSMEKSLQESH